ncbi:MAG: hypothetical protein HY704_13545 [Gemmatimonadetes bacterium]|nr:hypothetical protein [Gemmatimonadota bacterium]
MALKTCWKCEKQYAEQKSSCPYCGAKYIDPKEIKRRPTKKIESEAMKRQPTKRQRRRTLVIGIAVLLLLVNLWQMFALGEGELDELETGHTEADAVAECRRFIQAELGANGSVRFPDPGSEAVTYTGGGEYEITGIVFSRGGSGLETVSEFLCIVQYAGESDWEFEDLELTPM